MTHTFILKSALFFKKSALFSEKSALFQFFLHKIGVRPLLRPIKLCHTGASFALSMGSAPISFKKGTQTVYALYDKSTFFPLTRSQKKCVFIARHQEEFRLQKNRDKYN